MSMSRSGESNRISSGMREDPTNDPSIDLRTVIEMIITEAAQDPRGFVEREHNSQSSD